MSTDLKTETCQDVWDHLKATLGLKEQPARAPRTVSATTSWDSSHLLAPRGDGHRTAHLLGLAGSYLACGFSVDQMIEHCLLWNTKNNPPLDEEKVISTCNSIAKSDARNHPDRPRGLAFAALTPSPPAAPLFDILDARIGEFLHNTPPPQRWVLEGVLPLGIVAALVAQGGVGKSQLLIQTGFAVATGIKLAGYWAVGEPGTVLMLCAEDSKGEIHRRVHRIQQQIGSSLSPALQKLLEERFLIRSMTGEDALLTQVVAKSGEVVRSALTEQLLLTAQQAKDLKLIILDTASRFRGGDENSNLHATRFVQALEYLALNTGATVLIAHHTGKGASNSREANQDASRGASALTDSIRWQMALTSLTNTSKGYTGLPPKTRHLYMEAKVVKTNYTAPQPEVLLLRGDDGYLQVTTLPDSTTPAFIQDKLDQISLLRLVEGSAIALTARQIESLHGGVKRELGISEKAVRGLLTTARVEGYLEGASGKPVTITDKGKKWLASQSGGEPKARWAPRGKTTHRVKAQ